MSRRPTLVFLVVTALVLAAATAKTVRFRDALVRAPASASAPPSRPAAPVLSVPSIDTLLAKLASYPACAAGAGAREFAAALRATRASPHSSDAFVRLASALADRARVTLATDLYAPVEQLYLHAYKLDPGNPDALSGLAWAAGAAHRFEDSVAWGTLALRAAPDQPEAHALLGDAALELGRYAEARLHYEKLQDLRPGAPAYARLAQLHYQQGEVFPAFALMRRALAAADGGSAASPWYAAALATLYTREGAAPLAVGLLEPWLKRRPDDVALLEALGAARVALDQDDLALAAYQRAATLQPRHASLAALYELQLADGHPDMAAATLARVEGLAGEHRDRGIRGGEGALARFYADAGIHPAEAVRLAEAEASHHRTPAAIATLAWALHRAGRTGEARRLLPELLRHRLPEPAFFYYAALISESSGDPAAARCLHAAALARQPRWSPVQTPLSHAALARLTDAHPAGAIIDR